MGLLQVIADPRTSLPQNLEALLIAELADNDSWRLLVELASIYDQHEIVADFRVAGLEEQRHLDHCRRWLSSRLSHEAGAEPGGTAEQAA
jgi:hypothetical protein